jgi:Zn-dependent membrane protease YugP
VKDVVAKPTADHRDLIGCDIQFLLQGLGMSHVAVESTAQGDHYDPVAKVVRLSPDNFEGRSLTAVTVAAHEVGHALQDQEDYTPLALRTRLVTVAAHGEKIAALLLMLLPILAILSRSPVVALLIPLAIVGSVGLSTFVHLLTLPTEMDASFARALPLLQEGGYLREGDLPHARRLLKAAALTYVSASLMSLLNLGRWLAVLRR